MSGFFSGINGESSSMGILRIHARSPGPLSTGPEYWQPKRLGPPFYTPKLHPRGIKTYGYLGMSQD